MRRRRDYAVDGGEPDALDWDLDINLELELRDDQQSRLYRYLSEGHRPRSRNESPRRAATVTLANRSVRRRRAPGTCSSKRRRECRVAAA